MAPKKELDDKQLQFIQNQYAPGADITTIKGLVAEAQSKGMDVFKGECHFVEYSRWDKNVKDYISKWSVQTGIDFYRKTGMATKLIDTVECNAYYIDENKQHAAWMNIPSKYPAYPDFAVCEIKRKDMSKPIRTIVFWNEYVKTNNGKVFGMWARMPGNQLCKCAESACWRKACPDEFAGLYSTDEMEKFIGENQKGSFIPSTTTTGKETNKELSFTEPNPSEQPTVSSNVEVKPIPKNTPLQQAQYDKAGETTIFQSLVSEIRELREIGETGAWAKKNKEAIEGLPDEKKSQIYGFYDQMLKNLMQTAIDKPPTQSEEPPKIKDLIKIVMSMKDVGGTFLVSDGHIAKEFASFLFEVKNTRAIPKDRLEKALNYYTTDPNGVRFMTSKYLEFQRRNPAHVST